MIRPVPGGRAGLIGLGEVAQTVHLPVLSALPETTPEDYREDLKLFRLVVDAVRAGRAG